MSTLSGLASKGEKGKLKFRSLDINNLYRASRGESSEKQQQKSTPPFKYGMQTLGKVPSARRPPANLPSIKSEHSGTDAAVSLVPSGGPGWGKQDSTTPSTSTSPSTTSTTTNCNSSSPSPANIPLTAHQAAIALPVTTTIPPPAKHSTLSVTSAATDKSWSSVMSGNDMIHPPPYQSPQFQHEFPSLSAGDGNQARPGTDTQYGPGPSLRPQTEGSWMQGGSRANSDAPPRSNSVPLGAPPQLSAQVGLAHQQLPSQYHGILPTFMFRGNATANGHGTNTVANAPPVVINNNNRARVENRPATVQRDGDEVARRPIIKEEDLNRMDDMTKDMGWAAQDEIDYNQKLEFSDDEAMPDRNIPRNIGKLLMKESENKDRLEKAEAYQDEAKNWNRNGNNSAPIPYNRGRTADEDEILALKRRQQHQVVTTAAERAKQRKEEEEKKYLETKLKNKRDKDQEDGQGTISPSVVPPQPITPAPIPVPDWEKEPKAKVDATEDNRNPPNKNTRDGPGGSDFRQMTQIEAKNFVRKDNRNPDRSNSGYTRQMQNLPPRLQKKQQLRNNSSPQPPMPYSQYDPRWMGGGQNTTKTSPTSSLHKMRNEWEGSDKERDDDRLRYSNEDVRRGGAPRSYSELNRKSSDNRYSDDSRDGRNQDYDYKKEKDDGKWEKSSKISEKEDVYDNHMVTRQSSDEWHSDRHDKYRDDKLQERYERPQRPDSRDSRTSRDSRHSRDSMRDSEPREHLGSWAESIAYEERKKEMKEDRRQVPGPITKEKIEADEKQNEKRNLTQLKKGGIVPVSERRNESSNERPQDKESETWTSQGKEYDSDISKPWADDVLMCSALQEISKQVEMDNSKKNINSEMGACEMKEDIDLKKTENMDNNKEKDDKRIHQVNRNRQENNRSQGSWDRNSGSGYRSWYKKPKPLRSGKSASKGNDWQCTDSDGSVDDISCSNDNKDDKALRNSQKSPKPNNNNSSGSSANNKKIEKEERNKDMAKGVDKFDKNSERKYDKYAENSKRESYEPRGEPSRLGRGGGNIRGRGGLSKRIDGYGPPSLKSPFSHTEDRDKKQSSEEPQQNNIDTQNNSEKGKSNNNAGIIGSSRKDQLPNTQIRGDAKKYDDKFDRGKARRNSDNRKPRLGKLKDDNGDTSEHSDDSVNKHSRKSNKSPLRNRSNVISRRNQPPRLSGEKRTGNFSQSRNDFVSARQNSSGSLRSGSVSNKKDNVKDEKQSDANSLCNAIADITLKNKEQNDETDSNEVEIDEKNSAHGDSDGFQEVKSKKTVKDRQKVTDEKPISKQIGSKQQENIKTDRKGKSITSQLSQQQIANIPSLMDTPINPPSVIPQPANKNTYDRSRNAKLPPRLAKQREQGRLQKVQMHQHSMCDVNDMKKVNQNIGLYGLKDTSSSMQITNAWDKPIQLRSNIEAESVLSIGIENCKSMDQPHSPSQNNGSPNAEKVIGKNDRNQIPDKSVLDGTTPPVNTIIFENTNYKSTPAVRNNRNEKTRTNKIEEAPSNIENSVMSGFTKPITDLLSKNDKPDIQMQLSFNKEDTADMKLDFFESDISHLTDDKTTKNLSLPKSMHSMTSSNSTISPSTADLNFKIASVKKVWDNTMPPVLEHSIGQEDSNSSFSTSFGPDPNSLDASSAFSKGTDTSDDAHEGYSSSPNQNVPNSTTNVCKVKPTQQVPGTTGQNVGTHQQHSGIISSGLMAPLSSPPIQPVIGPNVGLNQAPQQYTTNQHIGYQAGLGGSNQYGIPAIPSPPVVYNSTQQLQPQAGLYGGFPIDQLGGQRTSQFSQYANPYNLGQTASSPYSAQSLYLPTAQPHAPPAAQAPPDIYQSINNYRIPNTAPYGQNQQLNNPTTVLISSTSNSLMSASVKPSSQPISAIGTKTGTINQTFQQQSQQGQQPLYMAYEPAMQPNYLPNTGVMQRGPPGPVQNNVVPALQASSSFYSGSTGGQTGYFQQPGNSTLQSGPLQQHQASYGLQGNVFGTHNQSHTSAGLQNLNSHFLSQMQFAMNVQQYRSQNLQNTSYLKSISNQQVGDQSGRSQQLKSPGTQQEVLSSVFNSGPGPQIPSPKSRQNCKQPPPQPSPTTQHKYNLYQSVGNQQSSQTQRYPQPIQRPSINYQPNLNSVPNNGSNNHKHRTNTNANKGPPRQYYSPQGGGLPNQNEKSDDSKLVDNGTPNSSNSTNSNSASIVNKTAAIGSVTNATINKAEITKDKDESSVIKD